MSIAEQLITIADKVAVIESDVRYAITTAHSKGYNVLQNGGLLEITKLVDSLPMANSEPISSSYKDTFLWQHFTNGKIISYGGSWTLMETARTSITVMVDYTNTVAIAAWITKNPSSVDLFYNFPYPAGNTSEITLSQGTLIEVPLSSEIGSCIIEATGLKARTSYTISVALIAPDRTVTFLQNTCSTKR